MTLEKCGILLPRYGITPKDLEGCHLPSGHADAHEFLDAENVLYKWETDFSCDCLECQKCDGDWCVNYWKADASDIPAQPAKGETK